MSSAGDRADEYISMRTAVRKSEGTDGEKLPLGAVDVILCHIHLLATEVRRSREELRVRSASTAQVE